MNRSLAAVLLIALAPSLTCAGKIKSVTVSGPKDYDKAQFQQSVVSSEGRITLARLLKPLASKGPVDAARIWDVVEDRTGNLIVATGDEGKIFKITPDGQVSVLYETGDSQVLCLAAAADGTVYAGTGPKGQIVRLDPAGAAPRVFKTPANYVWALAADEKDGTLYAATGPHGRIYRVADGKADVFFQCKQEHLLSMARTADGFIYAGTDKQGLVYRVDTKGKGYVLFQAAQTEVRCLQLAGQALYIGTSSPANSPTRPGTASGSGPTGSSRSNGAVPLGKPDSEKTNEESKETKEPAASAKERDRDRDGEKYTAAAGPTSPGGGENSVYRVGLDGSARELFREKGLILSLLKINDRLYVGTGAKGQLFEVNEATKERSEVARLEGGQVHRLAPRRDGSLVLATGDPGKLYSLQDRYAASGSVTGEVIDAKLISRWGAISWQGDVPTGTKLTVSVRGGNVAEPDDTWSDWTPEQIDPKTAVANVPSARYLQFRVSLGTGDPKIAPSLHHLTVRYATLNQAPEVTSLEVPTPESIASSKDPKKLRFKWAASDANEDELAFDLYVRKDGWKDWVRVEEGWSKNEYEWDTTTMPSGEYRLKIVASDRPDNNEEEALTGERISSPVIVAHEAPTVTLKLTGVEKGRASFEATGASGLVRLSGATYAVDGGKWQNLYPTDGLFDSKEEKFRFGSESLAPGTHVMVLRVRDTAGNTGSADVVFTVPTK
jgi:sugar lactone lactonase YvrE